MRSVDTSTISNAVARLCVAAATTLPPDVDRALQDAAAQEPWAPAKKVLGDLCLNLDIARAQSLPPCQDTGMACVFIELGQQVHLTGASLQQAVDAGVRAGYGSGHLRKSIVADPLRRQNTGDNTPAMLTVDVVPGDRVSITVTPKGFGSENMSRLAMLNPSDGRAGVEEFIVETVRIAGPNPCPPVVVGVGIGGSFDKVALLAKKALLRPLDAPNPDPWYAAMEAVLLERINALGIGPAGTGGGITALGLAIETAPTHIAGLPVAVNLCCHVCRRASEVL